jgi:hypothetical protein
MLNGDGTCVHTERFGSPGVPVTTRTISHDFEWLVHTPAAPADVALFEVMVTNESSISSAAAFSGTFGAWVSLTGGQTWSVDATPDAGNYQVNSQWLVQFRRVGTTAILAQNRVYLQLIINYGQLGLP